MKYPIGIQTFDKIRNGGYLYVDKTDLIYRLAMSGSYYFLSRPRRFGKSLLISTLEAYFEGRKELFKGLAIEKLETEWESYPVLHMDFNSQEFVEKGELVNLLNEFVSAWEDIYGRNENEKEVSRRFAGVIRRAHEKTGKQVVVLIDEYDKPLLNAITDEKLLESYRSGLQAFYSVLKSCDRYIRFALLTGVTRFSKLSVFSGLNNLNDISMDDDYVSICGITENELELYFRDEIMSLAEKLNKSYDETLSILKLKYDGYHFTPDTIGIYNPFSLLSCLQKKQLNNYWYATGTPSFLVKVLQQSDYSLEDLPNETSSQFDLSNIDSLADNPASLLFQAGYLTIQGRNDRGRYLLGFPNMEVKEGFLNALLPAYTKRNQSDANRYIDRLLDAAKEGDPQEMLELLHSVYAGVPFESAKGIELHYRNIIFLVMYIMGLNVEVENHSSRSRLDFVLKTDLFIYVMEFKLDKSPGEALAQIEEKGYALQYAKDPRRLFLIGVNFSSQTNNIDEWKIKIVD